MYDFGSYQEYLEQYEEIMKFMMSETVNNIMSVAMALVFSVIAYIFQSRAMYAVAKRRGIERPWLAWVPVGSSWMIGCISDQYRYVKLGQVKNKRKVLLWLEVGVLAATVLASVALIVLALQGVDVVSGEYTAGSAESYAVSMLGILAICFGLIAVSVAYMVVYYMSLWDYFHSCNPQYAKLFFLLSVLITYPQPFFMFACRDKDLGMPPRRCTLPEEFFIPPMEQNEFQEE